MGEAKRRRLANSPPDGGKPLRLSERAKALCERIEPGAVPVLLPFTPRPTAYETGVCHWNVEHCVREHGGERVPGWVIWDQNPLFAEAEFHSVWRDPNGKLVDVTPRVDQETEVIWLPSRLDVQQSSIGGTIPTNPTTLPTAPYLFLGEPSGQFVTAVWDPSTRAKLRRLGFGT